MTQPHNSAQVSEEDAFHFIVRVLRENFIPDMGSSYGYDVYLPNIVMHYLISVAKRSHAEPTGLPGHFACVPHRRLGTVSSRSPASGRQGNRPTGHRRGQPPGRVSRSRRQAESG